MNTHTSQVKSSQIKQHSRENKTNQYRPGPT
jgi:hypothetical protein